MGGGGGHTTSTVTQSNLPEYAQPFYESMMKRALGESDRPYQPYMGQRLAGASGQTQQGLNMARGFAASPVDNTAARMTGQVYNRAMSPLTQRYDPASYRAGTYDPGTFASQSVTAGDGEYGYSLVDTPQTFGQEQAQQYMSPYMDEVIQRAMADVKKNTLEEQVYRNTEAARAGAFGGSRAAVQNQMALGQAQERMADISVEGRQAAFENAQQQFERDRAALMQAGMSNQEASLQAALSNAQRNLEAQQLGEQSRQFGAELGEQSRQFGAELREGSRQFGRNLGLQGLELASQQAGQLSDIRAQQDQQRLDRIKAQLGVGQTIEDYRQQQLDQAYADFVNQRDVERQNLQFLSSILRGVPISANQDVTTTEPTNPLAGMLGTATGLEALMRMSQQ